MNARIQQTEPVIYNLAERLPVASYRYEYRPWKGIVQKAVCLYCLYILPL